MKRSVKLNIITSLILQILTILNGLIIPRIILVYFGSEVNGLVSSLLQFLNYINLLEGGVSGVIMASMYKPLAHGDDEEVSSIIKATNQFFHKIGLIFIIYSIGVAVVYPLVVGTKFSWPYIFSLTLILSASLYIQYFFAYTFRLLLQADRCGYIVSISQIGFVILNLVLVLLAVKVYPSIHAIKIASVVAYVIQPIVYNAFVKRHYKINKHVRPSDKALAQRWDGLGQNIAYFIHSNTDIVILTLFTSLTNVSVYSVYFMVIHSLRDLINAVSTAIVPSVGNILATDDNALKQKTFDIYEYGIGITTCFTFACGAILIVPFVLIYTSGVTDANYDQPVFGIVLLISEAIYCYRSPYINVTYASGHFKQTAKYAYMEAALNIIISVLMVARFGLVGVAIGTAVSMTCRFIAHIIYLKKNILYRPIRKSLITLLGFMIPILVSAYLISIIPFETADYKTWIVKAFFVSIVIGISLIVSGLLLKKEQLCELFKRAVKR